MKSILTLLLSCSIVLSSFKTAEEPLLVNISGTLIDYHTSTPIQQLGFVISSGLNPFANKEFKTLSLVQTDSNGSF